MKTTIALIFTLAAVALSLVAQEKSWTKKLKAGAKRTGLQDGGQYVRGDSGRWSEKGELRHAPRKPSKVTLDNWFDQSSKKKNQPTGKDGNWLLFRTEQLDDNDRVWIERIERRGNQFTVVANKAKWQGKYFRNFTYYPVIAVDLGKLDPGKYEAKWLIKPLVFRKFDGDGKPRNNWPEDERPSNNKPAELRITFTVANRPQ